MISFLFSPAYFLILGVLCGAVGFRIGWRARNRFVLPFVQGLLGWVAFYYAWRSRGPLIAAASVVGWALATSIVSLYFFTGQPQAADQRVLHVESYRAALLERLRAPSGAKSPIAESMRTRLRQLFIHLALATLTVNFAALVVGAVRLNAMNASVATLLRAGRRKGIVALMGWPVWIVVRVTAFAALGSAAAAPLATRLGYPARPGSIRPLVVAGAVGVALDVVLELLGSRAWRSRLAGAVDLDAAAANRGFERPFHLGLDDPGSPAHNDDSNIP